MDMNSQTPALCCCRNTARNVVPHGVFCPKELVDDVVPPYSILCKIIFHDIDIYVSVCEKGNPFRRLVCIDCRRHDLLTVVYEDLCAEPVKDHPQFRSPFLLFTRHRR